MHIIQYFLGRWVLGIEKTAKLQNCRNCRKQILTLMFTSDAICRWGVFVWSIHLITLCIFQCE